MSCGKTLGHGISCVPGYLCDHCIHIRNLEAKLARIAAIIEQHTASEIDEQTAFDRICEEMECKT